MGSEMCIRDRSHVAYSTGSIFVASRQPPPDDQPAAEENPPASMHGSLKERPPPVSVATPQCVDESLHSCSHDDDSAVKSKVSTELPPAANAYKMNTGREGKTEEN